MGLTLISPTPIFHALALHFIDTQPHSHVAEVMSKRLHGMTVAGTNDNPFVARRAIQNTVQEELPLEGVLVENTIPTRAISVAKGWDRWKA